MTCGYHTLQYTDVQKDGAHISTSDDLASQKLKKHRKNVHLFRLSLKKSEVWIKSHKPV